MGLTNQQDLSDYWSKNIVINMPFYAKVMPRDRFLNILTMFHLADNAQYIPREQPGHNPLYKLGFFYTSVVENFGKYWVPNQEITIDEGLVPFDGRIRFKVYNPAKPKKYGIKSFELCDGQNAYCCKYRIYTGYDGQPSRKGRTYDTVMSLCEGYTGCGRILFVDNFYTSPQLFYDLSLLSTFATGTARARKEWLL